MPSASIPLTSLTGWWNRQGNCPASTNELAQKFQARSEVGRGAAARACVLLRCDPAQVNLSISLPPKLRHRAAPTWGCRDAGGIGGGRCRDDRLHRLHSGGDDLKGHGLRALEHSPHAKELSAASTMSSRRDVWRFRDIRALQVGQIGQGLCMPAHCTFRLSAAIYELCALVVLRSCEIAVTTWTATKGLLMCTLLGTPCAAQSSAD